MRIHPQQTWKVKRRTQYRPDGRNAYQIIFKIKWEKVDTFQAQFATNDGYKMFSYRYPSEPLKSYDYLFWKQDLEEMFRFQGIVIRKFWEDIDPETHIQVVRCKVYGDRKEGVRRYAQMICDRFGEQMEVEYI